MPDSYYCPEGYPTCRFSCRWWQQFEGPRTKATRSELEKAGCQHPKLSREPQLVGIIGQGLETNS